ncbi:hypothetical protein FA15DRAFT_755370 [Coprinopsis marcescibilis]|nr:hypothetical protein FA15DRAFT_755370 [Coprinopsis marcescibilis]
MRLFSLVLTAGALISPTLAGFSLYDRTSSWRESETTDCTRRGNCQLNYINGMDNLMLIPTNNGNTCGTLLDNQWRTGRSKADLITSMQTLNNKCGSSNLKLNPINGGSTLEIWDGNRFLGSCIKPSALRLTCHDSTTNMGPCQAESPAFRPHTYCRVYGTEKWRCANVPLC